MECDHCVTIRDQLGLGDLCHIGGFNVVLITLSAKRAQGLYFYVRYCLSLRGAPPWKVTNTGRIIHLALQGQLLWIIIVTPGCYGLHK